MEFLYLPDHIYTSAEYIRLFCASFFIGATVVLVSYQWQMWWFGLTLYVSGIAKCGHVLSYEISDNNGRRRRRRRRPVVG